MQAFYKQKGSRNTEVKAGKCGSLHSPQSGRVFPDSRGKKLGDMTHDYGNVFGWNKKK